MGRGSNHRNSDTIQSIFKKYIKTFQDVKGEFLDGGKPAMIIWGGGGEITETLRIVYKKIYNFKGKFLDEESP